jgi:hypothetical protein
VSRLIGIPQIFPTAKAAKSAKIFAADALEVPMSFIGISARSNPLAPTICNKEPFGES